MLEKNCCTREFFFFSFILSAACRNGTVGPEVQSSKIHYIHPTALANKESRGTKQGGAIDGVLDACGGRLDGNAALQRLTSHMIGRIGISDPDNKC